MQTIDKCGFKINFYPESDKEKYESAKYIIESTLNEIILKTNKLNKNVVSIAKTKTEFGNITFVLNIGNSLDLKIMANNRLYDNIDIEDLDLTSLQLSFNVLKDRALTYIDLVKNNKEFPRSYIVEKLFEEYNKGHEDLAI